MSEIETEGRRAPRSGLKRRPESGSTFCRFARSWSGGEHVEMAASAAGATVADRGGQHHQRGSRPGGSRPAGRGRWRRGGPGPRLKRQKVRPATRRRPSREHCGVRSKNGGRRAESDVRWTVPAARWRTRRGNSCGRNHGEGGRAALSSAMHGAASIGGRTIDATTAGCGMAAAGGSRLQQGVDQPAGHWGGRRVRAGRLHRFGNVRTGTAMAAGVGAAGPLIRWSAYCTDTGRRAAQARASC